MENSRGFTLSEELYHKSKRLSSSAIKQLAISAKHYKVNYIDSESKDTPAKKLGRLFHKAMLEPEEFRDRFIVEPKFDKRTKIGKQGYADFILDLDPKAISVSSNDYDSLIPMLDVILETEILRKILKDSMKEFTIFWNDEEWGEKCKARFDILTYSDFIVDIKTINDASSDDKISKDIFKWGYHISAYWYIRAFEKHFKRKCKKFVWVFIESGKPHGIKIVECEGAWIELAEKKIEQAQYNLKQARQTKKWECYNADPRVILPIDWMYYS